MRYLIVHATGEDYHYASTLDYGQALTTYDQWLAAYADAAEDRYALSHLDWLRRVGPASRAWVVEYRSHRYGNASWPEQVFVLGALTWPRIWRFPSDTAMARWERVVKQADHPAGHFELRTDGRTWRTFWFAERDGAAIAATRSRDVAAEAAAEFAFFDALSAHARTGEDASPPGC